MEESATMDKWKKVRSPASPLPLNKAKSSLGIVVSDTILWWMSEEGSNILLNWVYNKVLKANPDKFHLLLSNSDENLMANIEGFHVFNSKSEK